MLYQCQQSPRFEICDFKSSRTSIFRLPFGEVREHYGNNVFVKETCYHKVAYEV